MDRGPVTAQAQHIFTVEDEYGNVKLITDDLEQACRLAEPNDWWVRDESAVALFGREDDEE
jgi:hypothetical protein